MDYCRITKKSKTLENWYPFNSNWEIFFFSKKTLTDVDILEEIKVSSAFLICDRGLSFIFLKITIFELFKTYLTQLWYLWINQYTTVITPEKPKSFIRKISKEKQHFRFILYWPYYTNKALELVCPFAHASELAK